jgi:hypothetical protein
MTTMHNLYPGLNNYVTEASGGTWISDESEAGLRNDRALDAQLG